MENCEKPDNEGDQKAAFKMGETMVRDLLTFIPRKILGGKKKENNQLTKILRHTGKSVNLAMQNMMSDKPHFLL